MSINNLIKWFPIIWRDRDWDTHFIWEILKFKLENQSRYLGEKDRHVSTKREVELMKTCIRLMDRVQHDYYGMESFMIEDRKAYIAKYPRMYKKAMNETTWRFTKKDNETIAIYIGMENHKRAKKLLFDLLETHIERWWD